MEKRYEIIRPAMVVPVPKLVEVPLVDKIDSILDNCCMLNAY